MNGSHPKNGFTFIELIIVMAVLGLIVGLVAPNYFRHLDESREVVLKNNLNIMRQAINDYYADNGVYPLSLDTLVSDSYLKSVSSDPITRSSTSWKIVPPRDTSNGIYDVISGADGKTQNGILYSQL
ncbi:MAG: prepilin-type N-terminal cleavage/methylation domain-containing protein [Candidatus Zeuxoniibacter abyssi]|nr:MAG: prepilin-type N-terminal cleavage/methylation domain-containing protein [Candidatus Persebacteraceae bacterium AB1(2)]